jgi:choline dehydrogenase
MGASQVHWWWRSREGLDRPDTQPLVFSLPMYEPWMSGPASGFTIQAGMVTPRSRGSVTLTGADPRDPLAIDLGALTEREDLDSLVASVQQAREVLTQPALADWGVTEVYPGPSVRTEEEVRDYVRRTAITYHHQVGTAKMGVDEMAVVDPERLAVRGVTGLHVGDASVIPVVPAGNTNAPAILIAEKLARALTSDRADAALEGTRVR